MEYACIEYVPLTITVPSVVKIIFKFINASSSNNFLLFGCVLTQWLSLLFLNSIFLKLSSDVRTNFSRENVSCLYYFYMQLKCHVIDK